MYSFKQVILFSLYAIFISTAFAQTDVDALRYSTPSVVGSARNIAVGNTMGTIGADASALSTNPAAIGKFSSTEFSVSPAISINRSNSMYLGNTTKDSKVKFQLANASIVIASKYSNSSAKKWNGLKFGIGINQIANFNNKFYFEGTNTQNSLLTSYSDQLKDRDYIQSEEDAQTKYPFGASIAYLLGLITADSTGNIYYATDSVPVLQEFTIDRSGGINELAIGVGSIYNDKIMIGASVGLPIVNYTERITLKESDITNAVDDFNSFTNVNYLKSRGIGFNLKVGVIGMPITNLRLSLAIQTPGVIFMRDAYLTSMEVDYQSLSEYLTGDSPDGSSKYKYIQPWKVTAGAGYIHKYGFVSAEYELSDASNSKIKFNQSDADIKSYQNFVNDNIRGKYGLFHTIKAGVEFKYDPIRIRAGVQYRTSPFKDNAAPTTIKTSALTYSAGFGYRGKHFSADIAYAQTNSKEMYVPYQTNIGSAPNAILSAKKPAIILTLGYKL